ncbi:PRC-barrel domain-containing protein [Candidatus Saccharibacteria bacterium]|nr:PRC-barrel domain-containing protein [Candidatus Saccharibacteria bacterium]
MLINASRLIGFPVLSLHIAGPVATTESFVLDPDRLKISAFRVWGPIIKNDPELGDILDARDVREFSPLGLIIDSAEDFVNSGDVIKIDKCLELNFSMFGLSVVTKKGTKLGKIIDYTVDSDDFSVRQLIVKRPFLKSFSDPELVIPRKEIVEINDYRIIVKDEEQKIKKLATKEDFIPNFVNPFREPDFSSSRAPRNAETSDSKRPSPAEKREKS